MELRSMYLSKLDSTRPVGGTASMADVPVLLP